MKVTRHGDADEFWQLVAPLYTQDPIRHTIALTVLKRVREGHGFGDADPIMLSISDEQQLAGAVFCTPPFPFGLSAMPVEAARPVAEFLFAEGLKPTAAFGEYPNVEAFAAAWQELTGETSSVESDQRLYRLAEDEFAPPADVPGELTFAIAADLDILLEYRRAFAVENGLAADLSGAEHAVRAFLESGGCQAIWRVDGKPVSMAAVGRPVAGMSRVAPVYTTPAERGHGYGSAVTAGVSQWAIDQGASDVVLFTDLANPISNSIYQRIGYRPVMDVLEVTFTEAEPLR
ncbi:MAG TPA: GNAT family N-acetyltransferase [Pseudonocardiaceae bacterium]|jgi:GNAT superfamily N-acetyltransferase